MKGALPSWVLGSVATVAVCWHWNGGMVAGVALLGQLLMLSVSLNVHYYRGFEGVARTEDG